MDLVTRGVVHYFKKNPDTLLDIMIALGEGLKLQPKKKKEKFFAILEEGIRERVGLIERNNRLLRKRIIRLEKEIAALSRLSIVS